MRVLINENHYLDESMRGHFYYHFTTPAGALAIFDSNKFVARTENSGFLNGKKTVSFTRYAEPDYIYNPAYVRLMIDMEKLSHHYEIIPFNWFKWNARAENKAEAEVVVVGDIKNAKEYITRVDVCPEVFKDNRSIVTSYLCTLGGMKAMVAPRDYFEYILQSRAVVGITENNKILFRTKNFGVNTFDDFKRKIPVTVGGLFDLRDKDYCFKKALDKDEFSINSVIPDSPIFVAEVIKQPFDDEIINYYLIVTSTRNEADEYVYNYFKDNEDFRLSEIVPFKNISFFDTNLSVKGLLDNQGYVKSFYDLLRQNINGLEYNYTRTFIPAIKRTPQSLNLFAKVDKSKRTIVIS